MTVEDIPAYDAQVHAWGPQSRDRPWDTTFASNNLKIRDPAGHSPNDLVRDMDAAGVMGAIIVPPSYEPDNSIALAGVRSYPDRFRGHGRYRLDDAAIADVIRAEFRDRKLVAIRMTFNAMASEWMRDGVVDWVWDFAEAERIPVSLSVPHGQLLVVDDIAGRHPELQLSIDHLALSGHLPGFSTMDRVHQLEPLRERPNIALKVSALQLAFPDSYTPVTVRGVVDLLRDWYGSDRLFWGSDYTRDERRRYARALHVFRQGIAHLPPTEQRLLLGEALCSWFGWSVSTPGTPKARSIP